MKSPRRLHSTQHCTYICPNVTAAVYFRSSLHCHWLLCPCSGLHWRALSVLKVIKYTVTVVLIGLCLMMKVTLSSLAKIHTQQNQTDCWWWSDPWEEKKCGLDSRRPTELWWQCVVCGLHVCEQGCTAANETAPPAGSQPERKTFQSIVKIQNVGSQWSRD